jgi:hypothetical protein
MSKWIWRMLDGNNEDLLWLKLLRAKYRVNELFSSNCSGGSPFWCSIHKIKELFLIGAKFTPGRNSQVRFWLDTWLGVEPLRVSFPTLFSKCSDPNLVICNAWSVDDWNI